MLADLGCFCSLCFALYPVLFLCNYHLLCLKIEEKKNISSLVAVYVNLDSHFLPFLFNLLSCPVSHGCHPINHLTTSFFLLQHQSLLSTPINSYYERILRRTPISTTAPDMPRSDATYRDPSVAPPLVLTLRIRPSVSRLWEWRSRCARWSKSWYPSPRRRLWGWALLHKLETTYRSRY